MQKIQSLKKNHFSIERKKTKKKGMTTCDLDSMNLFDNNLPRRSTKDVVIDMITSNPTDDRWHGYFSRYVDVDIQTMMMQKNIKELQSHADIILPTIEKAIPIVLPAIEKGIVCIDKLVPIIEKYSSCSLFNHLFKTILPPEENKVNQELKNNSDDQKQLVIYVNKDQEVFYTENGSVLIQEFPKTNVLTLPKDSQAIQLSFYRT